MKFTFPVDRQESYNKETKELTVITNSDTVTFEVPAKSFLFNDTDLRTKLKTCHLGVVRQRFSDLDHFVLGSAFMENFYVVFDGENPKGNLIALNYQGVIESTGVENSGKHFVMFIAFVVGGAMLILMAVLITCACIKRRQAKKLREAKKLFQKMKTTDDGTEDAEESDRTDATEKLNPNGFISDINEQDDDSN